MAIRVLYFASGTNMSGGASKSLLAMLRQADKEGIEYEVVCPDENGITQYLRDKGVKVHVVHYRHVRLPSADTLPNIIKWLPRLIHDYWINFKARSATLKITREYSPDIVHENSSVIDVGYRAAKKLGIPDVIHIREYGDLDFGLILPGRDKRISDPDVYTISITKDIARHKRQDIKPKGIQIYNGIVSQSQFRYNPDKKPYFLYAGRIEEAKGVTELLSAYAEYYNKVKNPIPLYLAGGCNHPSYLNAMKSLVSKKGCSDKIKWLGVRKDLADLMYDATATIIPSRFEALGRIMPEAMANGCLCVGKNTGGTKEQMDNGRDFTGKDIALRYDTDRQLIDILVDITLKTETSSPFDDGGEYERLIRNGMTAVKRFFTEESFGKELHAFYNRIMSENRQSNRDGR